MENGHFSTTNVTSSVPSSTHGEAAAQTIIKGKGDPGYTCTTRKSASMLFCFPLTFTFDPVMLAECAVALLDTSQLTPLARQGGILTPVSAFGDELVARLAATGRFEIESKMIQT